MTDNNFGQGLNALIPPTKNNNHSLGHSDPKKNSSNDLEAMISQKVSQAFSNLNSPGEEKSQLNKEIKTDKADKDTELFNDNYSQDWSSDALSEVAKGQKLKSKDKIFLIETNKIKPNPNQPRHTFSQDNLQELADSIREYGIIEPLVVTKIEKEIETGTKVEYQLIAGERRWRAAKLLGLPTVPAIIKKPVEESRKLELALVENIQREDLSPIAQAKAFSRLIQEFNLTQQALALKLGKSREVIANALRLLQLPLEAQKLLDEGRINEGHARSILLFRNPEKRRAFLKEILVRQLSGRESLILAQKYLRLHPSSRNSHIKPRRSISLTPEDIEWKEKLENLFQVPVLIKKKGDRGSIEIKFFSQEEMEKIIGKLFPPKL